MIGFPIRQSETGPFGPFRFLRPASPSLVLGRILLLMVLAAASRPGRAAEPHYAAAEAAFRRGDAREAELEAKLSLQQNPLDAKSHFMLACLLAERGELDQAVAGFRRAVTLEPNDPDARYNLGTALLRRGESVAAAEVLESAVALRPGHAPSHVNLAKAYYAGGLPELAVAAYREALRLDPSSEAAGRNLALLVSSSGAEGAPARAVENDPFPRPSVAAPEDPQPHAEASEDSVRDLLRDMPHVELERRGGQLAVSGWTRGPNERDLLERILEARPEILDLTTDDTGDPQRMVEVDATIFLVINQAATSVGFDFLQLVNLTATYFATDHDRDGTGFAGPDTIGPVSELAQQGWQFVAGVDYDVNIANAASEKVGLLARPHLTTLSGTPAKFFSGAEVVFKVSGTNNGDIKPYPFGTMLTVTPTLLRTPGEQGGPRVHLKVETGRESLIPRINPQEDLIFAKLEVNGEAVLEIGQTLILSGISQRDSRPLSSGVPILGSIPLVKYFFSREVNSEIDTAVVVLLTPRDPAFLNQKLRNEVQDFVRLRRGFVFALQAGPEELERFKEENADWSRFVPNYFSSHLLLMQNSEFYRAISGQELSEEDIQFGLLGAPKQRRWFSFFRR